MAAAFGVLFCQDVDGAWAGGRGFKRQPYLSVADAGGGIITMDSFTMVTATVTPSLMVRITWNAGNLFSP